MKEELDESIDLLEDIDEKDLYINVREAKSNQSVILAAVGSGIVSVSLLEMAVPPALIFILGLGMTVMGVVTAESGKYGGGWDKLYRGLRNDIEELNDRDQPPLRDLVQARNLMLGDEE